MNLETEYALALQEIGEIKPWYSEEYGVFMFEHPLYPGVDYYDESPHVVIENYQAVLKEFISDRIQGKIADSLEAITSGRGGRRPGAGRPKLEIPSKRVRIPADIAEWLMTQDHLERVRRMMDEAS